MTQLSKEGGSSQFFSTQEEVESSYGPYLEISEVCEVLGILPSNVIVLTTEDLNVDQNVDTFFEKETYVKN